MTGSVGWARGPMLGTAAMFLVNGVAYASWVTRVPALRERLGLGEAQLGAALLAPALGAFVAFRLTPGLLRRHGSARVTSASAALLVLLLPLPGFASHVATFALSLFALGGLSGLMDVAMNAHAVALEGAHGRPILSKLHGLFSAGGLAGASGAAWAATSGLMPIAHLAIAATLLGLVVLAASLGLGLTRAPMREEGRPRDETDSRPGRSRRLLALGALAFCSSVGEGAMADWSALYMTSSLATSEAIGALGYGVFSVGMLVARFLGDMVVVRSSATRVMRGGGLIAGLSFGIALAVATPLTAFVGFAGVGIGLASAVPLLFRAAGRLPDVSAGSALSLVATLSYGGFVLGPPLIGLIAEHTSLRGALTIVPLLALGLSLGAGALQPADQPRAVTAS